MQQPRYHSRHSNLGLSHLWHRLHPPPHSSRHTTVLPPAQAPGEVAEVGGFLGPEGPRCDQLHGGETEEAGAGLATVLDEEQPAVVSFPQPPLQHPAHAATQPAGAGVRWGEVS